MYSFRVTSLVLNDGTEIEPAALTVFIGPNNAGKSQALKDVVNLATRPSHARRETVVISKIGFQFPEKLADLIQAYPGLTRVQDQNGNWQYHGLHPTLAQQHKVGGGRWPQEFEPQFVSEQSREKSRDWFIEQFGSGLVGVLTTEQRLLLVKEALSSEYDYTTENLLQAFNNAGSSARRRGLGDRSSLQHIAPMCSVESRQ